MKKMISILMAVMLLGVCVCAASAETVPQPEGGKKFENDWAYLGGKVQIDYEEEGYRVRVDIDKPDVKGGTIWEYSCYYHADTDSLVSVSSSRTDYAYDLNTGEAVFASSTYSGLDEEKKNTEFTINGEGKLIWKDGREDAGAGLTFTNIGRFEGVWKNEAEETEVEFTWDGIDKFEYTVYIERGKRDAETYAVYLMTGDYDPATGKLTAMGTITTFTKNASGEYEAKEDGETYDAIFSKTADGKLFYETANGIELEYDLLGHDG